MIYFDGWALVMEWLIENLEVVLMIDICLFEHYKYMDLLRDWFIKKLTTVEGEES